MVTTAHFNTPTEEQGSPPSSEERTCAAVVTYKSCASGRLFQSLEARGEPKVTPATSSSAGRRKKNRKKATKPTRHAAESAGNNQNTLKAGGVTLQKPSETSGSGNVLLSGTAVASVINEGRATEIPRSEETPLPINPVTAPGGDGKCASRTAVALAATVIVEKQEEEKWEVEVSICEQAAETDAQQRPPPRQDQFTSSEKEPGAHKTGELVHSGNCPYGGCILIGYGSCLFND